MLSRMRLVADRGRRDGPERLRVVVRVGREPVRRGCGWARGPARRSRRLREVVRLWKPGRLWEPGRLGSPAASGGPVGLWRPGRPWKPGRLPDGGELLKGGLLPEIGQLQECGLLRGTGEFPEGRVLLEDRSRLLDAGLILLTGGFQRGADPLHDRLGQYRPRVLHPGPRPAAFARRTLGQRRNAAAIDHATTPRGRVRDSRLPQGQPSTRWRPRQPERSSCSYIATLSAPRRLRGGTASAGRR